MCVQMYEYVKYAEHNGIYHDHFYIWIFGYRRAFKLMYLSLM